MAHYPLVAAHPPTALSEQHTRRLQDEVPDARKGADNDAIAASLRRGQMPCDGAWPAEQVDKLQQWIDVGKPA